MGVPRGFPRGISFNPNKGLSVRILRWRRLSESREVTDSPGGIRGVVQGCLRVVLLHNSGTPNTCGGVVLSLITPLQQGTFPRLGVDRTMRARFAVPQVESVHKTMLRKSPTPGLSPGH